MRHAPGWVCLLALLWVGASSASARSVRGGYWKAAPGSAKATLAERVAVEGDDART